MSERKTKLDVQMERARDLEGLILYFCVLRVVKHPFYEDPCIPGEFSWNIFQARREFHAKWKCGAVSHTRQNIRMEGMILSAREESMGIPAKLVEEVLGKYPPALGRGRVKLEDILRWITPKYNHEKAGQKKDYATGRIERIIRTKFYPKDQSEWKRLLLNPDTVVIPKRVMDILDKWNNLEFHWQTSNQTTNNLPEEKK